MARIALRLVASVAWEPKKGFLRRRYLLWKRRGDPLTPVNHHPSPTLLRPGIRLVRAWREGIAPRSSIITNPEGLPPGYLQKES